MDMSSLGFESWWPRRVLRRMISGRRAVCVRDDCVQLPARTGNSYAIKDDSRTPHMPLSAAINFERVFMARSRWKLDKVAYMRFSRLTASDPDRGPRRDRQL